MSETSLPLLDVARVAAAGRALPEAFRLRLSVQGGARGTAALPAGEVEFACLEVLRLLPGRRLVARTRVAGRDAVLKLFFGPGAGRYCERERAGCDGIGAAGVPTPARLAEVRGPAGGEPAAGLVFDWLNEARGLGTREPDDLWQAAAALARLHGAGYRHRDLHLDNFLRSGDGVHMIDGDGVRPAWRVPGPAASLTDLAVLCAQCPPLADRRLPEAYGAYAVARGWQAQDRVKLAALERRTRRQRRARVRRYLDKAQRDCSEYLVRRSPGKHLLAVRAAWGDALAAFAADPEGVFATGTVLKAGNSATVARLPATGLVVKRYNHKNAWQAVRRNLRPLARFRRSWCNGQRLHLLEVPTARPLLLVERRFGPLRGIAYLLMEDHGDTDLAAAAAAGTVTDATVRAVVDVLRALDRAALVHGDTKASNFLLEAQRAVLIDLDAMREGTATARAADRQRLLANFEAFPPLRERFLQALREAGLV